MVVLKILGSIDLIGAFLFLTLIFGITPYASLLLFSAGLLFTKGFFIFSGEPLSLIDLFSSILLIISIFIVPSAIFLWPCAFLLLAKGALSFM